jgi:undecaprenyl-diphosphatase
MIEKLIDIDREIFIYLNSLHSPGLDQVMFTLTNTWAWIPMYLLLLYWIVKYYQSDSWIFILAIGVTILLADRITSGLMKPFFLRLRPTHDPLLNGIVHTVNGYVGGKYGFASSHAANTTGVAVFVFLVLKDMPRPIWWIFIWAAFIAYTRLYLGVHYLGDLLAGSLVGAICGWGCYLIADRFYQRQQARAVMKD